VGDPFDQEELRTFLTNAGYDVDERVEFPGSVLFLGHVMEAFPAGALTPVRIEHEDGKVSSIRGYDLESSAATSDWEEVVFDLVSEFGASPDGQDACEAEADDHAAWSTAFEFVPGATVVRDHGADEAAARWMRQIRDAREGRFGPLSHAFCPGRFLEEEEWRHAVGGRGSIALAHAAHSAGTAPLFVRGAPPARSLRACLAEQAQSGRQIVFTAATERDLRLMDRHARVASVRCATWREAAESAKLASLLVDLEAGFLAHWPRPAAVVAAADVLGSRAARSHPFRLAPRADRGADEQLGVGDVVVHMERGVGVLRGLETISALGVPDRDMLRVEFANQASVLMPVWEAACLWRYGPEGGGVTLDKADGSTWSKRRAGIMEGIRETASRLVALAKEREGLSAPKIAPPAADYERFASGFRFRATPDQARAIEEVLQDLASGRPMDRLICGDVGYGKTEVALRAAAATAFAGKQVAVAAPTTVLARQHVETFRSRFAPFGIEVGQLSRFASPAETREAKKRLADGSLRIVIGTHAIAGRGVRMKDLGLLVVDEEQRFGVADKSKLAVLARGAHVLTMSATPIPRTLGMANIGLRRLSLIETPPARRLPVKTVVRSFDEATVASALRLERRRGGQSFFVCPRIEDIARFERLLREVVPELALRVVHSKMAAREIDETMTEFAAGKGDVLLTTNIIESGLDLPRANTIIVWRPDRFGLAQLHQLRGRVGRGNARAFAYFLPEAELRPTPASERRLQALQEFSRSGAGFQISDRDLELRGAGDLLGEEQAGHVELIGPALYRRLLDRALSEARGEPVADGALPELNIGNAASIPHAYVADAATRLEIYSRLFKSETSSEVDDLEGELVERFGPLPVDVEELFTLATIMFDGRALGVLQIEAGPRAVALTFGQAAAEAVRKRTASCPEVSWSGERLIFERPSDEGDRLEAAKEALEAVSL
jgi:transcription-repair coupling factor (superfamily II helicase)